MWGLRRVVGSVGVASIAALVVGGGAVAVVSNSASVGETTRTAAPAQGPNGGQRAGDPGGIAAYQAPSTPAATAHRSRPPAAGHTTRPTAAHPTATAKESPRYRYWPVIRVVDGDTVHVRYQGQEVTVRVIGIDTPETVSPTVPEECGGAAASRAARRLLQGSAVQVTFDATQGRLDRYGRTLAYLSLPAVGDYGLIMLKDGLAAEYTYANPYRRQATYGAAEATARVHHTGTWGACGGFDRPLRTAEPAPAPSTTAKATPRPAPAPSTTRKPPAPPPPPPPPPPAPAQPASCTPGYSPCLPPVDDWDCGQLRARGLTPVRVTGPDIYRLDADGDGWGCELEGRMRP